MSLSRMARLCSSVRMPKSNALRALSNTPADVLWTPDPERVEKSNIVNFMSKVEQNHGAKFDGDYEALWRWSVDHPKEFWGSFWDWTGIVHSKSYDDVVDDVKKMPGAKWFPGARLNFAENLLKHRDSDQAAYIFHPEHSTTPHVVTYRELAQEVAKVAAALRERGVVAGDRVVGLVPNTPQATVAMLAATSIGAVWASCSPDFGDKGVLDRFAQIRPKVLFTVDGYLYKGKRHNTLARLPHLSSSLGNELSNVVVMPGYPGDPEVADDQLEGIRGGVSYESFTAGHDGAELQFEQLPFDHPVYIMFSSGTTGLPKCMVQGPGVLIKQLTELQLLTDVKPEDRVFFYTTTGWMMWNWLTSTLATGATIVSYDGDPMFPEKHRLWQLAEDSKVNVFGTSARFLSANLTSNLVPKDLCDLSSVRTILSTGSPAAGNIFEYTRDAVGSHIQFGSISGGTDLNGCFAGNSGIKPVINGELQARVVGMDMAIFNDSGKEVIGETGELVCKSAFPSMPLYFWEDPEGAKYHDAYFDEFPGIWRHGDFAEVTTSGGVKIHGRSDATLNPGGVRIGTADIYRAVEEDVPEAEDSIIVGEDYVLPDGTPDVRIVLFLKLREGVTLDDATIKRIRGSIRSKCSPRHVPAKVIACPAIPYTVNGKKVEVAVKKVMCGKPVNNLSALLNPEALDFFKNLPEN